MDPRSESARSPFERRLFVRATGFRRTAESAEVGIQEIYRGLCRDEQGTLAQYTGRLHRLRAGKTTVRIFDCVDRDVPMLIAMFETRQRAYQSLGYVHGEPVTSFSDPSVDRDAPDPA